jgi:peptide/nickel transport system permease protein
MMLRFVIKKLMLFIPTLVVVYAVLFVLQRQAPGDPVASYHHQEQIQPSKGTYQDSKAADNQYANTSHLLGLDMAPFYFSITSQAQPDTLYKILRKDHREMLSNLLAKTGNWAQISAYYKMLQISEQQFYSLPDSTRNRYKSSFWAVIQKLYIVTDSFTQKKLLQDLTNDQVDNSTLHSLSLSLNRSYFEITASQNKAALYYPTFHWYGIQNQFHAGLVQFLQGNFGKSFNDNRPVGSKIAAHLKWTFLINSIAVIFIFAIGIPLGVYLSQKNGSKVDSIISAASFGLYALPVFWVATMLIHFFSTDTYHLNIFPASGVGDPFVNGWSAFTDSLWHLALPVICLIYHDLTYVTMQMKEAMLEVFQQDYIKTAIAKGLPQEKVVWKHAYPNAIFPMITHISGIVPAMISGSIMVENIFGIPGMGDLAVKSILSQDWPVVSAIVMITAFLTMLGLLLSDLLYAYMNPRVKLNN